MSYEHIQVERDGHLTIVTINRPDSLNAIHPPTTIELDEVWTDFAEDADQWVAILTGAGKRAFSAGNDLKHQAFHGSAAMREAMKDVQGGFGGITAREGLTKPVIAAVNGFALGGGFELALACDLIIASETAVFGLPEPRVGLMAAAGGVHRLPRHIGFHQAMGMILTGRRVNATEGQALGFVNEVVPPEELMAAARRWASQILECSPLSIRASKEAVLEGRNMTLRDALRTVMPGQAAMLQSEDFVEGPQAFAEKRAPNWQGK